MLISDWSSDVCSSDLLTGSWSSPPASAGRVICRRGNTTAGTPARAARAASIRVSLPAPDGPTTRIRTPRNIVRSGGFGDEGGGIEAAQIGHARAPHVGAPVPPGDNQNRQSAEEGKG